MGLLRTVLAESKCAVFPSRLEMACCPATAPPRSGMAGPARLGRVHWRDYTGKTAGAQTKI